MIIIDLRHISYRSYNDETETDPSPAGPPITPPDPPATSSIYLAMKYRAKNEGEAGEIT